MDDTNPSITGVSVTNLVAEKQTATISAVDEGSGIYGYYIGQVDPDTNRVTYGTTNTGIVNAAGTWYFSVKDKAGNVTTQTMQFVKAGLYGNGGTVTPTSVVVKAGSTITLPTPTRTGYDCTGWYNTTSGGAKYANAGGAYKINTSVNMYAQWTAKTYSITFNANGGSVAESVRNVTYGQAYGTLPTPTRSGYEFLGWFTAASGGAQVTSASVMGAGNVTVYAQWRQGVQTVTLYIDGTVSFLSGPHYNDQGQTYNFYRTHGSTTIDLGSATNIKVLSMNRSCECNIGLVINGSYEQINNQGILWTSEFTCSGGTLSVYGDRTSFTGSASCSGSYITIQYW